MKCVIFDWDGTLADTFRPLLEIWRGILGPDFSEGEFKLGFGVGPKKLTENYFAKRGLPHDEKTIVALVKKKTELQAQETEKIKPFAGVIELLDYLKLKGYRMAICSSNHTQAIEPVLKKHCMEKYFEKVITGDHMKGGLLKPHPDIFLYTAKELGVSPKDCIVFEDAPVGIQAAKAAGMKVIGVCAGHFTCEEISEKKPDLLVSSMREREKIEKFLEQE